MSFETPEAVAEELILFVDNDGDINRSQTQSILKNLMTKIGQGKYDHDRAVDLFMYLAESGAKKYAKEFGGPGDAWHAMFPVEIRRVAATHWRDEFEAAAKSGEYDSLLPKKYQKKAPTRKEPRSKRIGGDSSFDGAELAQRASTNLNESEIERIVLLGKDPPGRRRGPAFKRGYLDRMLAILNAMKGN